MSLIEVKIVHAENSALWLVAIVAILAIAYLLRQGAKTWQ